VGVRFQIVDSSGGLAPQATLGNGSVAITYAVIHVSRIEFLSPPGFVCSQYARKVSEEMEEHGCGGKEVCELKTGEDGDHKGHCPMCPMHSPTTEFSSLSRLVGGGCVEEAGKEKGEPAKIQFKGSFTVDLTSGASTPPLEGLLVPEGIYKRVDVRIDDKESADPQDPLSGLSFLAYGVYSNGTSTVSFKIALRFNEDIRFETQDGISIGSGGMKDFLVQFPVSTWLSGVDFAGCLEQNLKEGDTFVVIDEKNQGSSECPIEEGLKEAFKKSHRLKGEK
jgi:hypothetical protein